MQGAVCGTNILDKLESIHGNCQGNVEERR